jgi:hypothetical protein
VPSKFQNNLLSLSIRTLKTEAADSSETSYLLKLEAGDSSETLVAVVLNISEQPAIVIFKDWVHTLVAKNIHSFQTLFADLRSQQ